MEDKDKTNDTNKSETGPSFLRPSALTTSSSFMTSGKFNPGGSSNVFGGENESSYNNKAMPLANNPFAGERQVTSVSSSDSESDDKRPVIAPSHFNQTNASSAGGGTSAPRCLLKPSTLDKQTVNFKRHAESELVHNKNSTFQLEPPKLANPFGDKENSGGAEKGDSSPEKATETPPVPPPPPEAVSSTSSLTSDCSTPMFVFGQNMEQRVTAAAESEDETSKTEKDETKEETKDSKSSSEGIKAPEHVEVLTGEESESNVFSLICRLHVFEPSTQSWVEKGRGHLHLNDSKACDSPSLESRLIMRTAGNLRVILNSKIWSSQSIARVSNRSLRLSGYDVEQKLRIFLITANPKDSDQIFSAIDWRIQQLKSKQPEEPESPDSTTGKKRPAEDTDSQGSQVKKQRVSLHRTEESNDSVDPETEASNESCGSVSPTVKSTSSEGGFQ